MKQATAVTVLLAVVLCIAITSFFIIRGTEVEKAKERYYYND